jgi:hypothetical protein
MTRHGHRGNLIEEHKASPVWKILAGEPIALGLIEDTTSNAENVTERDSRNNPGRRFVVGQRNPIVR